MKNDFITDKIRREIDAVEPADLTALEGMAFERVHTHATVKGPMWEAATFGVVARLKALINEKSAAGDFDSVKINLKWMQAIVRASVAIANGARFTIHATADGKVDKVIVASGTRDQMYTPFVDVCQCESAIHKSGICWHRAIVLIAGDYLTVEYGFFNVERQLVNLGWQVERDFIDARDIEPSEPYFTSIDDVKIPRGQTMQEAVQEHLRKTYPGAKIDRNSMMIDLTGVPPHIVAKVKERIATIRNEDELQSFLLTELPALLNTVAPKNGHNPGGFPYMFDGNIN